MSREAFSTRPALILAALGMAIGTGNIWRFPRVVAENGGGAFIVAWMLFLLLWSIPLLAVEHALGRATRRGVLGAFASIGGARTAWMGGWIGICTTAILAYYAVVAGWCFAYFTKCVTLNLSLDRTQEAWGAFVGSPLQVLGAQWVTVGAGVAIVGAGVRAGIERTSRLLVPFLFVLLLIGAARGITLDGGEQGVAFMARVEWESFGQVKTWLEALTQSAWSTGAGWGLLLCYAVYARPNARPLGDSVLTGLGNNVASLLAALAVLPVVFAFLPAQDVNEALGAGNEGLTFIWFPKLAAAMPGGRLFLALFFLGLFVAALTSLVSMVELAVRSLQDLGLARRRSLVAVGLGVAVLGTPSALSIAFFRNQDWVWGLGLTVSGLFLALAVRGRRLRDFIERALGAGAWRPPLRWAFFFVVRWLIPVEFAVLVAWWFWRSFEGESNWWNAWAPETIGTCLLQWGIVLLALVLVRRPLARRLARSLAKEGEGDSE